LDQDIRQDVLCAGILTQRSNGNAVSALAIDVLHCDEGGVGLEEEAVVAIDDVGI